mmetsp:Transcript_62168/g.152958  ORF Transcript_62168/g.152958 Transcript_62168/m.152958 type:complete len:224 (-) Transcript_62168:192-863(-)
MLDDWCTVVVLGAAGFLPLFGCAGCASLSLSTPATSVGIEAVRLCRSPGPTTLPEASKTSLTALTGLSEDFGCSPPPSSSACRQSKWMCVTFVLTPSLCTRYVGSSVARTFRLSITLYFFFDLPTLRVNLSLTGAEGSPRIIPETSAMLTLLIFTSSTCVRVSPASICMHSSAEDPPTTSLTTSVPSVPLRKMMPTPARSFFSRRCTLDACCGLYAALPLLCS